jgi:hypothetical protein
MIKLTCWMCNRKIPIEIDEKEIKSLIPVNGEIGVKTKITLNSDNFWKVLETLPEILEAAREGKS